LENFFRRKLFSFLSGEFFEQKTGYELSEGQDMASAEEETTAPSNVSGFIRRERTLLTCHARTNRVCGNQSLATPVDFLGLRELNGRRSGLNLREEGKLAHFEQTILPHLDAAYNLARWLTRNEQDAEDMVQESYLRAFKFFDGFHGGDARAWVLTIVRNTCYTWLKQNRASEITSSFDEKIHTPEGDAPHPGAPLFKSENMELINEALEELPVDFREVVVLRDVEDLSYKEIARIANIPLGTVMSRLKRARERLKRILCDRLKELP
jgi:RNA polymerase sigma factor (sigma-70 family)